MPSAFKPALFPTIDNHLFTIPISFQVMEATAMRFFMMIAFLVGTITVCPSILAGDPALPGHHPLTQSQAGIVLISEWKCNACHSESSSRSLPDKTAPNLSQVGSRLSAEYMNRYLASPLETHPGSKMPDLLASKSDSERRTIADALTHFLVGQSITPQATEPLGPIDRQLGKSLFHSIGCVSCHGPIEPPTDLPPSVRPNLTVDEDDEEDPVRAAKKLIQPNVVSLEHIKTKYSIQSLRDFLFQPLQVRSSGRMPDMKLTPSESLQIAAYLLGDTPQNPTSFVPDPAKMELGKQHFQQLNCAACHPLPGMTTAPMLRSLRESNLQRGCLAKESPSTINRSPRFHFNDSQRTAILAAIQEQPAEDTDSIAIAKSLTAFRCINCHVREDYGGVHDQHQPYFQGSELNLGEDGRIPPPLTLVGAKLQPSWMKKVLFDGESVRQYMATRMPQYGPNNLLHLPALFRNQDRLEGREMKIPSAESRTEEERQREKTIRAAGRELLGDKGANCVACHQFNGKAANVNQGIDLLTSFERLQPGYFYRYLRNPGSFRPRTVMPTAWPDGKATFKSILGGDTDRQIEAIWYYLSLGTSAADPPGVRPVNTKLEVAALANLHRGRSRVAGFRGIAVGLPERISYAFNAETGTLSALWQGDFVRVNWSGQGSGDFNPAADPILLPQDVSFVALENERSPWPLMPVMTKESPVNPDPLYPKNLGYQFRGYYLDELRVPTFQYRCGDVQIEDRSVADSNDGTQTLKRELRFHAPSAKTLWFRALTGDILQESDRVYRSGRLRLTIPKTESILRESPDEPKKSELLLRLAIPQGPSSLELLYEPLPK